MKFERCALFTLALILWPGASGSEGAVKLPSLLSDNMVIQRDTPVRIWGWADRGERVEVIFRKQRVSTRAGEGGTWSVMLKPEAGGGPDEMLVRGTNTVTVHNILTGEVWAASGQSNMEFGVFESDTAARDVPAGVNSQIRLLKVPHNAQLVRARDVAGLHWDIDSNEIRKGFSAVAYLFGRGLYEHYKVPVGLIQATWGGTYAESWVSAATLRQFPDFAVGLKLLDQVTDADRATLARYTAAYTGWMRAHGKEDHGLVQGNPLWASPAFDASSWGTLELPRPDSAWGTDFRHFDGAIWYRREIEIPASVESKPVELRLATPYKSEQVYFNGVELAALPSGIPGTFTVPGELVRSGRALVSIRVTGGEGYVMIYGQPSSMYAESGTWRVPLSGPWRYRTGTDTATLPEPPPIAHFYIDPGITVLKNGMIDPLAPFRIRGFLWYQGESNVGAAKTYAALFPALIREWRRDWGYEFPFLYVQLAGYGSDPSSPADSATAELREAQSCALALPHTGMATAVDAGNANDIHPKDKATVAQRLLRVAAQVAYTEPLGNSGPVMDSAAVSDGSIRMRFRSCGKGLQTKQGEAVRGFAIAGADRKFVWGNATVTGCEVVVFSSEVPAPMFVRYDWANTPDGNLINNERMPVLPSAPMVPSAVIRPHQPWREAPAQRLSVKNGSYHGDTSKTMLKGHPRMHHVLPRIKGRVPECSEGIAVAASCNQARCLVVYKVSIAQTA